MINYATFQPTAGFRQIILVRHGESESNVGLPTCSPESIALTPAGHSQSKTHAKSWQNGPDLLITSNYLRARQTAKPMLDQYHCSTLTWNSAREFTYLQPSDWVGSTAADRTSAVKEYWSQCDPAHIDGAGAESFQAFSERVLATIGELLALRDVGRIAVFSHEQFIKAFMWCVISKGYQEINMKEFRALNARLRVSHCARIEFIVTNNQTFESVAYNELTSTSNKALHRTQFSLAALSQLFR